MHVASLLPASIRRAFSLMGWRFRAVLSETPLLFFGVVIGVALTFRVTVDLVRQASAPPVVAPTFVTTAPEPSASTTASPASPGATAAEMAARAQPASPLASPSPPRVAPRPRGHGRRPIHGGP